MHAHTFEFLLVTALYLLLAVSSAVIMTIILYPVVNQVFPQEATTQGTANYNLTY